MEPKCTGIGVVICLGLFSVKAATAQQVDAESANLSAMRAAGVGALSPTLLTAALLSDRALVLADGGYDSARGGPVFDSAAEVKVWGPLALRVGVTYADDTKRMRPS